MYEDIPGFVKEFLLYMQNIKNRSKSTIREYHYDLRDVFRFLKLYKIDKVKFNDINDELIEKTDITDLNISFVKKVELTDLYEYLDYLTNKRSDKPTTRARKIAALKSFFNYETLKAKNLEKNPAVELETPKLGKRLPKYLTLEESVNLLQSIDGKHDKRDTCIITLFLNCGLRLSELVAINFKDIKDDTLNVIGKGDKERSVHLNNACMKALKEYIAVRPKDVKDHEALFVSERGTRIGRRTVEMMVKKYITLAGLDPDKYSPHKLRHTAATLMHKYGGVDIRSLQQILGHESVATTEIYTHIDSEQVKEAMDKNPLNNM